LILILIILFPLSVSGDYPLKDGKPTRKGIEQYIADKSDSLIIEYQNFIGDTLYNVWIYAEDLSGHEINDSLELGQYYPNEVYVTTDELYEAYELADLSKLRRKLLLESNRFVKSCVIHELTHDYINQITIEMSSIEGIRVDKSYQSYTWLIRSHETFGSTFIEEGICEYVAGRMGEIIPPRYPFIPKNIEELTSKKNKYQIQYKYSASYLETFLDTTGLKQGIRVLLHNPPPSHEEILDPDLFFNRLVIP
jgi:hypothetical protein